MKYQTILFIALLILGSCERADSIDAEKVDTMKQLQKLPDSVKIGGITFNYGFKNQILAHANGKYDSVYVEEKFYRPNQYLFDSCFNFFTAPIYSLEEIKKWNETYLKDYDSIVWEQTNFLIEQNIDSLFKEHLRAVQNITGIEGKGKFLAYFPPKNYGVSGGCDSQSMAFDLMYRVKDTNYIKKVIPHEIEHVVYENQVSNYPSFQTGIGAILDEGLASYFEHLYLQLPMGEVLTGQQDAEWYIKNEGKIFERMKPYFEKPLDSACPLLYHLDRTTDCEPLIQDVSSRLFQRNLGYFLGFRIIETYESVHGKGSWKQIYQMPPMEFYINSGYENKMTSKEALN